MEQIDKYKGALKLAGELANAAQLVLNTDIRVIGKAIIELDKTLDEYNNYIINWSMKNGN